MPRIRALTPERAKRTLANRLAPLGDRVRQFATRFGVRPYRCFLTWTVWSGPAGVERGEGTETLYARLEVLPTPRVTGLDRQAFSLYHAGTIPVGSVQVDRISLVQFSEDVLIGKALPNNALPFGESPQEKHIPQPYEFFWEIVEDGRGDDPPKRNRYRPMNRPERRAGKLDWTIMLERTSLDRTRDDQSAIGQGIEQ
jgi:hypothetical protein